MLDLIHSQKKFKLGLVGAGRIGRVHAAAAAAIGSEVQLVAVADTELSAAQAVARHCGAEVWDIADVWKWSALDGVILATPPNSHARLTEKFLSAGVAVLCEKPMSDNLRAARDMAEAAARHNRLLAISSKFLFVEGVVKAKEMLAAGVMGQPLRLALRFDLGAELAGQWRVDAVASGGGVLADKGPQALDILTALLGPLVAVRATMADASPYPVEDEVKLVAETMSGAAAECQLSWRPNPGSPAYARLLTENGEIELGWESCRMRRTGAGWSHFCAGYNQKNAFAAQLTAFVRAARGLADFAPSLKHSLGVASVIEAAYQTGLTGAKVECAASQFVRQNAMA